jgi:hypothetical protein
MLTAWGVCCRYEAAQAGGLSEQEIRRKSARDTLERYHHYFDRFHSHDQARKKVLKEFNSGRVKGTLAQLSKTLSVSETQLCFVEEVCWSAG